MRKIAFLCALGAALSGCANSEQLRAEYAARDDAECKSLGAKEGSDAYLSCRLRLKEIRAKLFAAEIGARQQSLSTTCTTVYNTTMCN